MKEDGIVGWHQRLSVHEFEWTLGVGDERGGLACCSPCGLKELDANERLNSTVKLTSSNFKCMDLNSTKCRELPYPESLLESLLHSVQSAF